MQRQQTLVNGARLLVREAIRDPVREAVRDALREEATVVRADEAAPGEGYPTGEAHPPSEGYPTGEEQAPGERSPTDGAYDEESQGGSAAGKLGVAVLGLVGVLGLTYVFRRRGGGDSDPDPRHADATAQSGGYGAETGTEYEGDEIGTAGEGAGRESAPTGDQ